MNFPPRTNSRKTLEYLLSEMNEHAEQQNEFILLIDELFGEDKAVMVLDMSGFCRTTHEHGIITFMSMIYRMRSLTIPYIQANGGRLIKAEADNLYCLFDSVNEAVSACREINERLNRENQLLSEHCRINISIGIGYGRILNIEDKDLYGTEVNLASKLGEDIAHKGQVLLTAAAVEELKQSGLNFEEQMTNLSGLSFRYYLT